MKSTAFRTHVEIIHKKWLANTLCLARNHQWVDLYTDMFRGMELYFELKCRMLGYRKPGKEIWACREEQIQDYKKTFGTKNTFWIFLMYTLDRKVVEIKSHIAKKILTKEIWILPWNFVDIYPAKYSSDGFYRYPKEKDFPKKYKTILIENVPFHFTSKRIGELLTAAKEIPF